MICPHDHQECDNRGCRYGGCQGRPSGELIAHKDPRFRKKIAFRSQNGGTASTLREAEVPCPYCGPCLASILAYLHD